MRRRRDGDSLERTAPRRWLKNLGSRMFAVLTCSSSLRNPVSIPQPPGEFSRLTPFQSMAKRDAGGKYDKASSAISTLAAPSMYTSTALSDPGLPFVEFIPKTMSGGFIRGTSAVFSADVTALQSSSVPGMRLSLQQRECRSRPWKPMTWQQVLYAWGHKKDFTLFFCAALCGAGGFDAFIWECQPVRAVDLSSPFECVILDASDAFADRKASCDQFREAVQRAGDAMMVGIAEPDEDALVLVPRGIDGVKETSYTSFKHFLKGAHERQKLIFWGCVSRALKVLLQEAPDQQVWVSTTTEGAPWLHVRMDSAPKYIQHRAYSEVED